MKRIRIAICDDEPAVLRQLCGYISHAFEKYGYEAIIDSFSAAEQLREKTEKQVTYSLYFLDIDMGSQNGILLAEEIQKNQERAVLIFVSGHEEYVFETFRVQPFAFIRKRNFGNDLKAVMKDLNKKVLYKIGDVCLFTDSSGNTVEISVNDTMYVEAKDKYIRVVTEKDARLLRCTMNEVEKKLAEYRFLRVHRSYMVNCQYIYKIEGRELVLDNQEHLPVSRYRIQEIKKSFAQYTI